MTLHFTEFEIFCTRKSERISNIATYRTMAVPVVHDAAAKTKMIILHGILEGKSFNITRTDLKHYLVSKENGSASN